MDRVSGPYQGYFVAVYACEMGELGQEYLGHFKVLTTEPDSYWEGGRAVREDCVGRLTRSPEEAMRLAEEAARRAIAQLPARADFLRAAPRLAQIGL